MMDKFNVQMYPILWPLSQVILMIISISQCLYLSHVYTHKSAIKSNFLYSDTKDIVGSFYSGFGSDKYYLNNFDSLSQSYGEFMKSIKVTESTKINQVSM